MVSGPVAGSTVDDVTQHGKHVCFYFFLFFSFYCHKMTNCCWLLMTATLCSSFPPTFHQLQDSIFGGGNFFGGAPRPSCRGKLISLFINESLGASDAMPALAQPPLLNRCHRVIRCGVVRHRGHFVKKRGFFMVNGLK